MGWVADSASDFASPIFVSAQLSAAPRNVFCLYYQTLMYSYICRRPIIQNKTRARLIFSCNWRKLNMIRFCTLLCFWFDLKNVPSNHHTARVWLTPFEPKLRTNSRWVSIIYVLILRTCLIIIAFNAIVSLIQCLKVVKLFIILF